MRKNRISQEEVYTIVKTFPTIHEPLHKAWDQLNEIMDYSGYADDSILASVKNKLVQKIVEESKDDYNSLRLKDTIFMRRIAEEKFENTHYFRFKAIAKK